jgi:hypothetical protein
MRLQFIGKTKGKVVKVGGYTIKLGQSDKRSAAQFRVMATVSNAILDTFSPGLRAFLYEKAKANEKEQKQLDGIEVVSDLPTLREPGVKLGALRWEDEQTGCTFIIDRAINPIKLPDCKVEKIKLVAQDGGTVQVFFNCTTGELDRDTSGDLLLLNQQDIMFELTAPEPAAQASIITEEEEGPGYTPEQALADSMAEAGTAAEGRAKKRLKAAKKAAKKKPLAKSIARSSRRAAKAH